MTEDLHDRSMEALARGQQTRAILPDDHPRIAQNDAWLTDQAQREQTVVAPVELLARVEGEAAPKAETS